MENQCEHDSSALDKALEKLFDERKDFIIIGLTGRTGAGCTTVADILTKDFDELYLPKPDNNNINNNEDRKYRILYSYCKKNWEKFIKIEMRNIITSFLLEEDFNSFKNFIESNKNISNNESIVKAIESYSFKSEYNIMHENRKKVKHLIEESEENLVQDIVYDFYFENLPRFTINLKECIENVDKKSYTTLYQEIANNIRLSGQAFNDKFIYKNIHKLSERANVLIKILRKRNKEGIKKNKKGRVLVVIDALRNPYEVTFFKDRYSAFYQIAINVDEDTRKSRLFKLNFDESEINSIDDTEYNDKDTGDKIFSNQNIRKCIELSDIYIDNSKQTKDYSELKKKIVKYITLIMHPGLVTPTHIERTMQIAYDAKMNSGCISRQVGAVVTDAQFAIKSIGWNSVAENQVPCNLRDMKSLISSEYKDSFSKYEIENDDFRKACEDKNKVFESSNTGGRLYPYCFKDIYNNDVKKEGKNQVHTRSLHAEENAFLQISKYGGQGLYGGNLFTTASPCELCAKKAYQLGIENIYYIDPYPGISEKHILNCGTNSPKMILFEGVIGRAFSQLYTQIIPYKDEIKLLLDDE